MSVLRIAFLSSFVLEFFSTVSIAMVAVLIGFRLYWGEMDFMHGLFVLLLAPEFYLPLRNMGTQYHARMEAIGAAERIVEILDTPVAAASGEADERCRTAAGRHSIRGGEFSLSGRQAGRAGHRPRDPARRNPGAGGRERRGQDHPDQPVDGIPAAARRPDTGRRHSLAGHRPRGLAPATGLVAAETAAVSRFGHRQYPPRHATGRQGSRTSGGCARPGRRFYRGLAARLGYPGWRSRTGPVRRPGAAPRAWRAPSSRMRRW